MKALAGKPVSWPKPESLPRGSPIVPRLPACRQHFSRKATGRLRHGHQGVPSGPDERKSPSFRALPLCCVVADFTLCGSKRCRYLRGSRPLITVPSGVCVCRSKVAIHVPSQKREMATCCPCCSPDEEADPVEQPLTPAEEPHCPSCPASPARDIGLPSSMTFSHPSTLEMGVIAAPALFFLPSSTRTVAIDPS